MKQTEGKESVLDGVPAILPALLRAHRIVAKADRAGFRWKSGAEALAKVREEFAEFEEAVTATLDGSLPSADDVAGEFGDLVMALATLLLQFEIDPELAAREATGRFERRFRRMEKTVAEDGVIMLDLDRDDLLKRWAQARQSESPLE